MISNWASGHPSRNLRGQFARASPREGRKKKATGSHRWDISRLAYTNQVSRRCEIDMAAIERTPQRTRPLSSTLFYRHLHATAHLMRNEINGTQHQSQARQGYPYRLFMCGYHSMRPVSFPRGIPSAASTLYAGEITVRSVPGAGPQNSSASSYQVYQPGTLNRAICYRCSGRVGRIDYRWYSAISM